MSRKKFKNREEHSEGDHNYKKHEESKLEEIFEKKNKSYMGAVAAVFFVVGFIASIAIGTTGMFVSPQETETTGASLSNVMTAEEAGQEAVSFINDYLLQDGYSASMESIEESNGLYKMQLTISSPAGNESYTSHITKDGKLLFVSAIDLENKPQTQEQPAKTQEQPNTVPKTDKPEVNVFVMSYCPYGLQMEKAVIPVMKLLGDKADISIKYVDYAMHGKKEIDQNLIQYCIQKEQHEKFLAYLECFVQSDDTEACQAKAGINVDMMKSCIAATDKEYKITELYNDQSTWSGGRYPQFNVDADLNNKFGVRGSPTFVVNGKTLSVSRSPEAVKQVICSAFNTPPEECNTTLSTSQENPGIGALGQASTSGSDAGCAV